MEGDSSTRIQELQDMLQESRTQNRYREAKPVLKCPRHEFKPLSGLKKMFCHDLEFVGLKARLAIPSAEIL